MARKKPVVVTEEAPTSDIVAQAQQVIADVAYNGSNGKPEPLAITAETPAPAAKKPQVVVEEFSCKFGGHFKSADEWKFFTERMEFRGLMRTTLADDMALVRAGVVCKKHVEAVRKEAEVSAVDAPPWFFRLSATLEKVAEREAKRAELKAEREVERLVLLAKRQAEQEAMRVEVGSYLKNLQADQKSREEKLQRDRESQRNRRESFRKKNANSYSRADRDGNGRP